MPAAVVSALIRPRRRELGVKGSWVQIPPSRPIWRTTKTDWRAGPAGPNHQRARRSPVSAEVQQAPGSSPMSGVDLLRSERLRRVLRQPRHAPSGEP
jgi:hypothetical protein